MRARKLQCPLLKRMYHFTSISAALARHFYLVSVLGVPGSCPMNADDVKDSLPKSADSDALNEIVDVGLVLSRHLDDVQIACVTAEFSLQDMPIEGALYGKTKVEVVRLLCGRSLTADSYMSELVTALKRVRKEFECLGWLLPDSNRGST